jgi:hypothetical protein
VAQPPAGGAPLGDVVVASLVGAAVVAGVWTVTTRYRRGGVRILRVAADGGARALGEPRWAALPSVLAAASMLTAVFGFYWDMATHIDNGRDPGPFANIAHYPILLGLAGIAAAGYLALLLRDDGSASSRRGVWTVPVGGFLLLLCGAVALAGFPLDDVWHRLFGQDVTLWGPTHIQMIGGASLATLGLWVLQVEASGDRPRSRGIGEPLLAGAFLAGLSTLQAEFDYGVPQFRLLFHPVLLMLAASIGLVATRIRLGRLGALQAVLVFAVIRGGLALAVGPGLGRITPHFPLYLVEAVVVELVAIRVKPSRPVAFGLACGVGIGTIGLAAEWWWSHLWMPIPWPAELWPEGAVLALPAALAGGVLGGLIGRALVPGARRPVLRWVGAVAVAVAVLCLAIPAPTRQGAPIEADVTLRDVPSAEERRAVVTMRLDPPDAAEDALWFHALAWQGLEGRRGGSEIVGLARIGDGVYRTVGPVPVSGGWKTLVRLHVDDRILAVPVFLPEDPAIPAPEVPARPRFERAFVPDKQILQREALTTSVALQRLAYGVLAAIAAAWLIAFAWGLGRLASGSSGRGTRPTPSHRGATSPARR